MSLQRGVRKYNKKATKDVVRLNKNIIRILAIRLTSSLVFPN